MVLRWTLLPCLRGLHPFRYRRFQYTLQAEASDRQKEKCQNKIAEHFKLDPQSFAQAKRDGQIDCAKCHEVAHPHGIELDP